MQSQTVFLGRCSRAKQHGLHSDKGILVHINILAEMRTGDVIVIGVALGVLYLAISFQARSDNVPDFLASLETAVKEIAKSATENYENSCELQATCRSEQNCSKRECYLLEGQHIQTECVYVYNFTGCKAYSGSLCNNVAVDYNRGMVRFPGNNSVYFPDPETREVAFAPTVCTQRVLDATFRNLRSLLQLNESFFFHMYFAAADGVFRFYPARELLTFRCNALEPRVRTWYINAISVRKDLMVLLDTGAAMTKKHPLSSNSSLDTAKLLAWTLAKNLSLGDTLTMVSVNSSGAFLLGRLANISGDPYETANSLALLLGAPALDSTEVPDKSPSQFRTALNFAVANSTSGNSLKAVVFFTNSEDNNVPLPDLLSATLEPMRAAGAGVFVYDLSSGNASSNSPWDSASALCSQSKNSSKADDLELAQQNPFLFLNGYYSFLARARVAANRGSTPSWTTPYTAATDLGNLITVSSPAMSSDNSVLLGVTAIDVQTGSLDAQLQGGLEALLSYSEWSRRTKIPTISTFVDPMATCSPAYLKSCNSSQREPLQPFCNSSAEPASDAEMRRVMCCGGKACSFGHDGGSFLWIMYVVLTVAISGAAAGGCMTVYCIYFRRLNKPPGPESSLAIPYEALKIATNKFAKDNIIGEGGFSIVFRGLLGDQRVAVKRLKQMPDNVCADNFGAELKVHARITKHLHLVELKGACFHGHFRRRLRGGECCLVYELVEGGDLHQWLWPEPNIEPAQEVRTVSLLTWNKRKQIAHGIANGLDYLHRGLLPDLQVFHLDIKPKNILLDKHCTPKIADFGISQLYEPGRTLSIVKGGSFGYMAPEILQGCHKPSTKMDVFSFGMVLMQLITGRRTSDQPSLRQWTRNLLEGGDPDRVIDTHLFKTVQLGFKDTLIQNCRQMLNIAMDCTEENPARRPEMDQILRALEDLQDVQELELSTLEDSHDRELESGKYWNWRAESIGTGEIQPGSKYSGVVGDF